MKIHLPDGSGTVDLKYLVLDTDRHGKTRLYFRRKGLPKIEMKAPPGSDGFMEEYKAALSGTSGRKTKAPLATTANAAPETIAALIRDYYESGEFKILGPSTRKARKGILDSISERIGSALSADLDDSHVRTLRDEKADLREAANGRVKALRQLFKWAKDAKRMTSNPALDVPYLRSKKGGHHTWTVDEVGKFCQRHPRGSKARVAIALLLFLGVRRSDVVKLGPQMVSAGWISFGEKKGEDNVAKFQELPVLPELQAELDAAPTGHLAYLVTTFGKPFTANGFGNWFRKRCNEAELPHCSAHGLRKAGATIAANNGASEHQLMAIYNWMSPKQAALYTRKANRKLLAGSAMHLMVPDQMKNESVQPNSGDSKGWTKKAENSK